MVIDQANNVFVTSMNAGQPTLVTSPYNPYFVVSTDQGTTFSVPSTIDGPNYLAGSLIKQPMPSPSIGSDGAFYAAYPSYVFTQSTSAHIYLAKSNDLGTTFSYSSIYSGSGSVSDPLPKKGTLLITDPTNSNHLALFILLDLDGDADIYMIETTDGINWNTPLRVNQDAVGNGKMQDLVWADFNENGDLAVCWRDRRNGALTGYETESEIYGTIKLSGNANFEPDFAISSQLVNHANVLEGAGNDFMNVHFIGDTLTAVWGDVRTGTLNIFINKMDVISGSSSLYTIYNEKGIIQIYPNPASEEISIENFSAINNVKLINLKGELIQEIDTEKVNIQHLKSGEYLLIYEYNGKMFSSNFMKN